MRIKLLKLISTLPEAQIARKLSLPQEQATHRLLIRIINRREVDLDSSAVGVTGRSESVKSEQLINHLSVNMNMHYSSGRTISVDVKYLGTPLFTRQVLLSESFFCFL